jgi:hypothetical protein
VNAAIRNGNQEENVNYSTKGRERLSIVPLAVGIALFMQLPHATAASFDVANDLDVYGYISWRLEKVWKEPGLDANGNTEKIDAPREVSLPSLNVMMQYNSSERFKSFVNLGATDAENVEVRNMWGEYKHNQYFSLRLGKTYRRFGLYNEILDAVPTYIGIEPPELFDKDHLILSRTALAMVHGWVEIGENTLSYAWMTDNGEGGPSNDAVPMGFDVRYEAGFGKYVIGTSGYVSNGDTTSDVGVGDGSPRSGVLPWMAADDFSIIGAFAEANVAGFQLQAEFWNASHDATRDPDAVVAVVQNASVNAAQRARFLVDTTGPVDVSNVNTNGDYDVSTWYLRGGYSIATSRGEFVPYAQWDHYDNPETINDKDWGGDAEAGLADDGKFSKATLGLIYRPVQDVAFKLDGSTHFQKFNGKDESYSEIRFDVSYIFGR